MMKRTKKKNEQGLYPCPLCASTSTTIENFDGVFVVGCSFCGARSETYNSKKEALRNWNKRNPDKVCVTTVLHDYCSTLATTFYVVQDIYKRYESYINDPTVKETPATEVKRLRSILDEMHKYISLGRKLVR